MLWDRGQRESDDPARSFRKGDLRFTLDGKKLHGGWVLVRMRSDRTGGTRTNWLLIKSRDELQRHPRPGSIGGIGTDDGSDRRGQGPSADTPCRNRTGQGFDWRQARCGLDVGGAL
jgi:hypothetical protein